MTESDKLLHRCQLANAIHRDRLDRLLAAVRGNIAGKTMGVVEHDKRVGFNGIGSNFPAGAKRMRGREHEKEFLVKEGFNFKVLRNEREGEDGEIDVAVTASF